MTLKFFSRLLSLTGVILASSGKRAIVTIITGSQKSNGFAELGRFIGVRWSQEESYKRE
jgi:hypothetical protein